jgi:uncharacterized membrane protein
LDSIQPKQQSRSDQRGRYVFLDLYRGLIVLLMIEGHVVRELLTPALRATKLFSLHEVCHCITAPGFLFSAGFALAVATRKRWQEAITLNQKLFKRLWRAVMLILIGYALHLPYLSLEKTIRQATPEQWNAFFAFDVLQCIGFGLLFLRLVLFVLKRENLFVGSLFALTIGIVYASPVLGLDRFDHLPLLFSSALNMLSGSPFPVFPFLGFLFAGAFVSWLFLRSAHTNGERRFMQCTFGSGIFLFIFGFLLDILPIRTYPAYDFWSTSPNYFWMRLGILLVMLSLLWFFENTAFMKKHAAFWSPRWLTMLGMQSLFVYIAHLIILYGWVVNPVLNIRHWFGNSSGVLTAVIVSLLLMGVMIPGAFAWRNLKKYHPVLTQGLQWWMGFALAWSFFFHPW